MLTVRFRFIESKFSILLKESYLSRITHFLCWWLWEKTKTFIIFWMQTFVNSFVNSYPKMLWWQLSTELLERVFALQSVNLSLIPNLINWINKIKGAGVNRTQVNLSVRSCFNLTSLLVSLHVIKSLENIDNLSYYKIKKIMRCKVKIIYNSMRLVSLELDRVYV